MNKISFRLRIIIIIDEICDKIDESCDKIIDRDILSDTCNTISDHGW